MSVTPGARVGSYEVLASLGAGGMGAVYRARDAKLNREVALKVLLPENIAAIHGLEEGPADAGSHTIALVLELATGAAAVGVEQSPRRSATCWSGRY